MTPATPQPFPRSCAAAGLFLSGILFARASGLPVWSGQPLGLGAADGPAPAALFNHPAALAADPFGNIYVADAANDLIRKIGPDGSVTTLAGQAGLAGSADGVPAEAQFFDPEGVAVGPDGAVYVADTGNSVIRRIVPSGAVATLAGTALAPGIADGPGPAAAFNQPAGLAVDGSGAVYVADTGSSTIRRIAPDGTVATLAGTAGAAGFADGIGAAARFDHPRGLALDSAGNLYVADTGNAAIRRIAPDGTVATLAGPAGFSEPAGIAADGAGLLYVVDRTSGALFSVSSSGLVATVAGAASEADGSLPLAAPAGVAIDGEGGLYVSDTYRDVVRRGASIATPGYLPALSGPVVPSSAPPPSLLPVGSPSAAALPVSRLVNLSARASGAASGLIVGFVVSGSGTKSVLLRAIGPGLGEFGVADTLRDPQLAVFSQNALIASAGAWGGSGALAAVFSQVGAFPLAPSSADSAAVVGLGPGSYSVVVGGSGDASSEALAEIYDADGGGSAARLFNLSVRAWAGSGGASLMAGFVVAGSSGETILVRGIGPSLAQFGVASPLEEADLVLFDSAGNVVAENTGWNGLSNLARAFAMVGAFSLDSSSKDAALLVTLGPGAYSVQLGPAAGGPPGTGMIELYDASGTP